MKNKKNILTQAALSFMLSAVVLYANTGLLSAKASENDLHPSVKSIPVYAAQNDSAEEVGELQTEKQKADSVPLTFSSEQISGDDLRCLQTTSVKWHLTFKSDTRISVTAAKPVSQLYFQFEIPCQWTLTLPDGTERQGGENGFIHEYVDLEQSVSEFTVDVSEGTVFTGLFGFTQGETPDWVQKWLPPCETADLLVLPTHSDDEFLWFGGALPYYAGELGYEVQVVYMTNHYNNSFREHERLNALWHVGVRHYPVVCEKFTDWFSTKKYEWAVEQFGYENVLEFQVETLRRFHPRVVLAHDINGEYGHGAHILNAQTLLEALPLTNDPEAFPESAEKYGIFNVQKCYVHLWEENQIIVKWEDMKLSQINNKSAMRMADEGYRENKSQCIYYSDPSYGQYDCRNFGLAFTTVGYDTPGKNDMFEHIDRSEQVRVYPSSISDEKNVSATDIPLPEPEAVENSKSFPSAAIAIISSSGATVLLLIFIAVWLRNRTRGKGKVTDNESNT